MMISRRPRYMSVLLQQLGILLFVSLLIFAATGTSHAASRAGVREMTPAAGIPTLYLADTNFPNQSNDLYAIDATVGSTRWRTTITPLGDASMPFTGFGNVYVNNGNAQAFTAPGLTPLWAQRSAPDAQTTPVGGSGTILFGGARNFEARSASTGALIWQTALPDKVAAAAVVATVQGQSRVYFGTANSDTVFALDPASGTILWQQHLITTDDEERVTSPTVDVVRGLVYVGSEDNRIYALDAITGRIVWTVLTGGAIFSTPREANGLVYSGSLDGNFYALNAGTGQQIWSSPIGNVEATPFVAGNLVYAAGEGNNMVFALNASTGHVVWTFHTVFPSLVAAGLTLANGLLYVTADSTPPAQPPFVSVYALFANSGVESWRWDGVPNGEVRSTGTSAPPLIVI